MPRKHLIALLAGLAGAAAAPAATVFSDDFDANALGLNSVPSGWTVSGGTVDIIGSSGGGSLFDLVPGNGAYIDLDGSTATAGLLSIGLGLTAGVQYTATFDLAGSQRGSAETGTVSFGSASLSYSRASSDPFSSFSLSFTPAASGSFALSFQNVSGDNFGALLDNVSVTSSGTPSPIPEPQTYALMLAGLALVGCAARRRGRG